MGSDSAFGEPNYAAPALAAAVKEAEVCMANWDQPRHDFTQPGYANLRYSDAVDCVLALRSLLAALRAVAPAPIHKMSYSRVIHTTAGDTWQESEDGVHWVDTPRVYLTDSCGALRRVEVKP